MARFIPNRIDGRPNKVAVLDTETDKVAIFSTIDPDDRLEDVIEWMENGNLEWIWEPDYERAELVLLDFED